jgi:DNA-binding MarR family transcriptional regulator
MDKTRRKRRSNSETKALNEERIYDCLRVKPESTIMDLSEKAGISRGRVSLHLRELQKKGKVERVAGRWSTTSFLERRRIAETASKRTYRRIIQVKDGDLQGCYYDLLHRNAPRAIHDMEFSDVSRSILKEFSEARLMKHGDKDLALSEAGFFPSIFARSVNVEIWSPFQI